ncbi:MAG: hypothetical protein ACRBEQ_12500 [Hyphomonas sp.]
MRHWIAFIALSLVFALQSAARDDAPTAFSKEVTRLTGDWEAEDWREGTIKIHPNRYTWQSDYHLTLFPEEPANGRTLRSVGMYYFDGWELDDDLYVEMGSAKEHAPGILMKTEVWQFAFTTNVSGFGVIKRSNGNFIPFHANCERFAPGDFKPKSDYAEDECLRKFLFVILALQQSTEVQLDMPAAPAALTIPGWKSQTSTNGLAVATQSSFNGLRTATILVAPPETLTASQTRERIQQFSQLLIDDSDNADKDRGSLAWVGSVSNPWIRRIFPKAYDGPSFIMAGTTPAPNGQVSLIGVRCPNDHWKSSCARGIDIAQQRVKSGVVETHRRRVVAATHKALPKNGIKTSQVEGIYVQGRGHHNGLTYTYSVDGPVLLKNGTAYDCFDGPLAAVVPAISQQETPECWAKWRRAGGKIILTWPDRETDEIEIDRELFLIGGDKSTRISANYKAVSAGSTDFNGSGWVSRRYLSFKSDGTFNTSESSSFAVNGPMAGDGALAVGGSNDSNQGRYEIEGYNLKLIYPDGRIEWRGFAQYATEARIAKKSAIMLDGTMFFEDDGD